MKIFSAAFLVFLLLLSVSTAFAGDHGQDLPPEERRELRKQMREHWLREYRGQRPEGAEKPVHWRDLPPEERRRLRDEMREQLRRESGKPLSHCPKAILPLVKT